MIALWREAADVISGGVDHHGEFFIVVGSLPQGPSPQGSPLLVQAGGSRRGGTLRAGSPTPCSVPSSTSAWASSITATSRTSRSRTGEAERRYDEQNALLPDLRR